MLTTTLREIRSHMSDQERWSVLFHNLNKRCNFKEDTPIPVTQLLDAIGLDDTLWVINKINPTVARLLAVGFVTPVSRLMDDSSSREAMKVAHLYAHGEATDTELTAAWSAAWAAREAAWSAAWAARDDAAWAAAVTATEAAAWATAVTATRIPWTAWTSWSATAGDAARDEQKRLVQYICDNWEESYDRP
jgi:hypothetical protein